MRLRYIENECVYINIFKTIDKMMNAVTRKIIAQNIKTIIIRSRDTFDVII